MRTFFKVLCASFAALTIGGCQTNQAPAWQFPEGVSSISVNGYPMAHKSVGSGPIVVLVPGVMCDYRCWTAQMKPLADDFQAVAVSLRRSYPEKWDGKGSDFSVAQHADDLGDFIERVSDGPVFLVGHSYGAHVAYEVARARPGIVKKLVLVEAPLDSLLETPASNRPDGVRKQRAVQIAKLFEAGDMDGGLAFAVESINGPGAWGRLPEPARNVVRDNAWTVVGLALQEPAIVKCADFGSLRMPVLLVTGEGTTPRFRRIVQEQSECLPHASVARIPNAGHGPPYQNPQAFNAAIVPFLKQ